ncbi:pseudouridine synthase [Halovenus sp. WSH3]|uniref:Pseudouridine synthase n=1 Tax=Halovenus carboxidivorans TaxID=2692199 RepID=A0A6B0TAC1_9EURY|nr:PUA domain-containing protein [Halovenus carboxidivorans]MXR52191.1 pseudouridine synthase [Halovenus carboxidivorans]
MADDLDALRTVADYQFGPGGGTALFPPEEELSVTRTSSGRLRQIHVDGDRLGTYEQDGRLRLGIEGGRRLQQRLPSEGYRVVVGDESEPFVRDGKNAFAKFVTRADGAIRPRDEVIVEHEDGRLLAVGRAELSGRGMLAFETGMAVQVRDTVGPA